MKSVIATMVLLAGATVGAVAEAAPPDAAAFAADCNADGEVRVEGRQRYVGGVGVLTGTCLVVLGDGATIVFRGVDLTGTDLVTAASHDATTVRVVGSTFEFSGVVELNAGCCAGDATVPEANGSVVIRSSTIRGAVVALTSSFDWPGGRVIVRDSTIETAAVGASMLFRASDLSGSDGLVRLVDSNFVAAGDVVAQTGALGRTVARRNVWTVAGSTTVSTGATGTCITSGNTPVITCS